MKKYLSLLLATLSAIGFSSCEDLAISEPDNSMTLTTITAEANATDTKTVIDDDLHVSWIAGDQISVFYGASKGSKFTTSQSGDVAEFKGSIDIITGGGENLTDNTYLWGVYPYNANNSCDGNSVTLTLPAQQQAKAGSFASGLFPQIAKSQKFHMAFYNLCACIRFKVTNPDITKVTLWGNNGEAIAGTAVVSMDQYPVVDEITSATTKLVMDAPNKGYFEPGKYYYFVIFPTEFEKGITIAYHKKDSQASYSNTKSFTLERNTCSNLDNADADLKFISTENLDIKVEDLNVPWSYKSYRGGSEHAYHPHDYTEGQDLILTVDTDVDLSKLEYEDEKGNRIPLEWGINFTAAATDNTGAYILNSYKERIYGDIDLRVEGPNTLALSHAHLLYNDIHTNYKFRFTLVNPETNEYYNAGFNVELGPKPADKVIHLGNRTAEGSMTQYIYIYVQPINMILDLDQDYYSDIVPDPKNLQEYLDIVNYGWEDRGNHSSSEGIQLTQPSFISAVDNNGQIIGWHDKSCIEIYNPESYEANYTLQHTYSFYGINYTFVAEVQLVKPNFIISTNPMFVSKDNVVTLAGSGKLPSYENGEMIYGEEYMIRANLRDYIIVEGISLRNVEEVDIIYELKDRYMNQAGQMFELEHIHFADRSPAYYIKSDDTGKAYLATPSNEMHWYGYEQSFNGYRPNNITIEYRLVSRHDENIVFGSQEIRLTTPGNLVKFQTKELTKEFVAGQNAKANIAKALVVYDVGIGEPIYNKNATSLWDLFDYRDKDGNVHGNAYNIYDIRFIAKESKIRMYLENSGMDITGQIAYSYDESSGDFVLETGNANLTDNIIVEIPISMTYAFQGDMASMGTVRIKFERVEESETIVPEPGQWSFESPDYWGDVNTILYLYDNCGIVQSIEDAYINQGISEDTLREWGWKGEWGEIVTRIKDFDIIPKTSTSGVITGTYVTSNLWTGEYEEIFEIQYTNCTGTTMDIVCNSLGIGEWDDTYTNLTPVTATKLPEKVMIAELNQNIPASGQWAIFTDSWEDTSWLLDLGVDSEGATIAQSFESSGLSGDELSESFGWNGEWGYKILDFTEYWVDPETKTSGTIYLTVSGSDETIEIQYANSSYGGDSMTISSEWLGFYDYQAIKYGNKENPLDLMTINQVGGMDPLAVK